MNWAASEWGANGAPYVYNGTTRPLPAAGDYIGQRIMVANAAVPRGVSRLEWTGTIWAPPAGELIFSNINANSPIISVTSLSAGVRVAIGSYDMPPEYMWPNLQTLWIRANFVSNDSSSTANQSFGITVTSDAIPSSSDFNNRILSQVSRPAASSYCTGIPSSVSRAFVRNGASITASEIGNVTHYPGDASCAIGWPGRTVGVYTQGSTKIVLDVNPGATTNVFKFYGAEVFV